MTNYAVTDYVSPVGSAETVAAAIETKLETIDNSKTIRLVQVVPVSPGCFQAVIIFDA